MNSEINENSISSPYVSVTVPVYNGSSTLQFFLNALKQQSNSSHYHEIIVVDDGSKDNIADLIKRFVKNVNVFTQINGNSYKVRNTGIDSNKGDILALTEADHIQILNWVKKSITHYIYVMPILLMEVFI